MIQFTSQEKKLFRVIKDYALSLKSGVVPRLAGGFVRDKILNIQSSDIDVALENISGINFAHGLSETLKDQPTVHKISSNPEKSKHLETAVLNILGFSVDFVQLRSESYSHTRIPLIVTATAKEDAERRDITINSLFYNLITDEIEDFTGRGLEDIKNKKIDTPLDPRITLFDDPLRILRIFRFKSKFGFDISSRIYEAISDPKIKEALAKKVSNERVFIEIDKMLKYPNGEDGLLEIVSNGYIDSVLKPTVSVAIESQKPKYFLEYKKKILEMFLPALFKTKAIDYSILKFYTVLQFFIGNKVTKKKTKEYLNVEIVRDSLKASRELINTVENIERSIELFGFQCKNSSNIDEHAKLNLSLDPVEFIVKSGSNIDEHAKLNLSLDPVEFIVKSGELWFEALVILYSSTFQNFIIDFIKNVVENNWQECYLTKPKINGDFLISKGINRLEFKRILIDSLILQIKKPNLSEDEIFEIVNKNSE